MRQLGTIHSLSLFRCSPFQGESLEDGIDAYCCIGWSLILTHAMKLQWSTGISAQDGDPKPHTWSQ